MNLIFQSYRDLLIYHELGHWIVARKLGFRVGNIDIRIILNHRKEMTHKACAKVYLERSINDLEGVQSYILSRMAVLAGGVIGQKLVDKRSTEEIWETNGSNDKVKTLELAHIYRSIFYSGNIHPSLETEQIEYVLAKASQLAKNALDDEMDKYLILVEKLKSIICDAVGYGWDAPTLERWIVEGNDS